MISKNIRRPQNIRIKSVYLFYHFIRLLTFLCTPIQACDSLLIVFVFLLKKSTSLYARYEFFGKYASGASFSIVYQILNLIIRKIRYRFRFNLFRRVQRSKDRRWNVYWLLIFWLIERNDMWNSHFFRFTDKFPFSHVLISTLLHNTFISHARKRKRIFSTRINDR